MVVVAAYAFTMSYAIAEAIDRFMGFRVSPEDETTGVDFTQHAESAYAEGVHGHLPARRPGLFGGTLRADGTAGSDGPTRGPRTAPRSGREDTAG